MVSFSLSLVLSALAFAAKNLPEQVHIALAGSDGKGISTGMSISWVTPSATKTSRVMYGTTSAKYTDKAEGISRSYHQTFDHHVVLPNLLPSTRYFYRCGDDTDGYSDEFYFITAPSASVGFSASVYGDMGYGERGHAITTRNRLETIKKSVNLFWHLGDIGYADDDFLHTPAQNRYEEVWNDYMNWMENITAFIPYHVLPGNHESECHSPVCLAEGKVKNALANFSAFNSRFNMPYRDSKSNSNMWHSFNYGLAHFISIDTETDFKGAPEEHHGDSGMIPAGGFAAEGAQLKWLEQDLIQAVADRAAGVRPWIFVGGHRPMYDYTSTVKIQMETFEALFKKYQVDMYFGGHLHSYLRSWPVFDGKVTQKSYENPDAPVHIVIGSAGCDEMDAKAKSGANGPWVAFEDTTYFSTGVLRVWNSTHTQWSVVRSDNGAILDDIFISKKR